MKLLSYLSVVFTGLATLVSCSNDNNGFQNVTESGSQLEVKTSVKNVTRSLIEGTKLGFGEKIGISLYNTNDGAVYSSSSVNENVLYTNESRSGESWQSANPIMLNETVGKAIAYYPYKSSVNVEAIPIETASQTDYMYSDWVQNINANNPGAVFYMNHAMCAIKLNITNETYTGPGVISNVTLNSQALATSASLNSKTGKLSSFTGQGSEITKNTNITIDKITSSTTLMAIPVGVQGDLTINVTLDGKVVPLTLQSREILSAGKIYTVGIRATSKPKVPLEIVKVTIENWAESNLGNLAVGENKDEKNADYILNISTNSNGFSFKSNVQNFTGTIDWGDGTSPETFTSVNNPSHTYVNQGNYVVSHIGSAQGLQYDYINRASAGVVTDIVYIGAGLGLKNMENAFFNCNKIKDLKEGLFDNLKDITSFSGVFNQCTQLAFIPETLFYNCNLVKNFSSAFDSCESLANLPPTLFSKCVLVENFFQTFMGCKSLKSIPSELFSNNVNAFNFTMTFANCLGLTSLPDKLFFNTNTSLINNFEGTFSGCEGLISIPENLFAGCSAVTDFTATFLMCNSLISIPENLFNECVSAERFKSTFSMCSNLRTLPERLFFKNINAQEFENTFSMCLLLDLEPRVASFLFANQTNATSFKQCFLNCSSLVNAPSFYYNTQAFNFDMTFANCTSLTLDFYKTSSMFNSSMVFDFLSTFMGCSSLKEIPARLFNDCPNLVSLTSTFEKCTSLRFIEGNFLSRNAKIRNLIGTFRNCSQLEIVRNGFLDNNIYIENINSLFEECTYLSLIPSNFLNVSNSYELNTQRFYRLNSMDRTFYNCSRLTTRDYSISSIDKDIIMETPYFISETGLSKGARVHFYERTSNISHKQCFYGCKRFKDYNKIPNDWK